MGEKWLPLAGTGRRRVEAKSDRGWRPCPCPVHVLFPPCSAASYGRGNGSAKAMRAGEAGQRWDPAVAPAGGYPPPQPLLWQMSLWPPAVETTAAKAQSPHPLRGYPAP